MAITNELIFIGSGLVGAIAHYIKKAYIDGATEEPIWRWFGMSNIKATMTVCGTFLFVGIGALNSGVITDVTTLWGVIYTGLLTGYSSDTLNKDEKQ